MERIFFAGATFFAGAAFAGKLLGVATFAGKLLGVTFLKKSPPQTPFKKL